MTQQTDDHVLHTVEVTLESLDASGMGGRADEELRRQLARASLLNRITQKLSRALDPTEVLPTAVEELGLHLGVDRCTLFVLDPDADLVRATAQYVAPGVQPGATHYPASQVGQLIRRVSERGTLLINDVGTEAFVSPQHLELLRAAGVRSVMFVAVTIEDETPAALGVSRVNEARPWDKSEIALVCQVADQVGIALRQARLLARAEATSRRERFINRLGDHIRASLDLSEMLQTATRELGEVLGASRVYLRSYDPSRLDAPVIHLYLAPGIAPPPEYPATYDDPIGRQMLKDRRILIAHDAQHYTGSTPEFNSLFREQCVIEETGSEIMCPLIVQGTFRGVLCIHQVGRARRWTPDEIALVETVAAQLAAGIVQAELFEMVTRAKKEWEATFDAMSDGIFIFDNEKRLVRANRAGAALEDSTPNLLLGCRCCELLRTHSVAAGCVVERAIAERRSTTLEVTPERLQRPLLVTVEPITEDGRTAGAVCTVRDLSELYEVQTEARTSQSLLTNIVESAREAIFALDTQGYVQWCNGATLAMSGLRLEELIGQNFLDRVAETDRKSLRRCFRGALGGEAVTCEVCWLTPDGSRRFALLDYTPLVINGRTTGVLGIARDVTEQKQERELAAQADKLRALGQLASGVAHDLNNSLAAILGRAQLLERLTPAHIARQHLDIITTAAEDAAATVRRVQTFARQSKAYEFELLDARALIGDAIEITRTRWENEARARGCLYDVALVAAHDDTPLEVMGIASELREIFVNLIVNAIDAMPDGGRLMIAAERSGERLRVRFVDTGAGMPPEVCARIFEPFFTTKGLHGTGLGLFVSYGIVERHGGTIKVASELGSGATFTVELPAAPLAATRPVPRDIEIKHSAALSVLVVDDEDFVRSTLGEIISALGHEVQQADGGKAALELLERERFQIIFTDLSMPDMDGWEVARTVRELQPDARTVLVTGYGSTVTPPAGEEDIVSEILSKPFDIKRVAELLQA